MAQYDHVSGSDLPAADFVDSTVPTGEPAIETRGAVPTSLPEPDFSMFDDEALGEDLIPTDYTTVHGHTSWPVVGDEDLSH
jgi:hypothetical protein